MAGIGGLCNVGLGILSLVPGRLLSWRLSFSGFDDLRLRPRRSVFDRLVSVVSSLDSLLKLSISPCTVLPLVARYSSDIPTKRMIPRSGVTPSSSDMKVCIITAFRLLVTGCIWEGRAVMVMM